MMIVVLLISIDAHQLFKNKLINIIAIFNASCKHLQHCLACEDGQFDNSSKSKGPWYKAQENPKVQVLRSIPWSKSASMGGFTMAKILLQINIILRYDKKYQRIQMKE